MQEKQYYILDMHGYNEWRAQEEHFRDYEFFQESVVREIPLPKHLVHIPLNEMYVQENSFTACHGRVPRRFLTPIQIGH